MSGQWEVVGKKKDKIAPSTKQISKNGKNKNVINGPTVEDVLPKNQLKNLFASEIKGNKENQKPQSKEKPKENANKKQEKQKKAVPDQPKAKPPKSIESALNLINVDEFKSLFENSKSRFPEAPLVWLKELSQFLNVRCNIDVTNPVFSNKSEMYPYCIIPSGIKSVMETAVKEAGKSNSQIFFDISMTAMATDMSKQLPALGHKFFIQHLALEEPNVTVTNLSKHITLKNSYQNRQPIGLSILWSLGVGGIKDLEVGLKVFQEVMLPLLDMKNFSHYVLKYVIDLINRHKECPISRDNYLMILDVIHDSNKKNYPNDLNPQLLKLDSLLQTMVFASTKNNEKTNTLIEPLLKRLQNNSSSSYKISLCDTLIKCLVKDSSAFGTWGKIYSKYLSQSSILLKYMVDHWNSVKTGINVKVFKELINTYKVTNDELMLKKRKEDGLSSSVNSCKVLLDKMAAKKSSGFPWKTLMFFVVLAISGFVFCDIKQTGEWNKSVTYMKLKEAGVWEYTEKACDRTKQGLFWARERIEEFAPGYFDCVANYLQPYGQAIGELSIVLCNVCGNIRQMVVEKYPAVIASIESYAPGLLEQSQKTLENVWSTSVLYYHRSCDYLSKEVFVGQLAPENMQRVVIQAFNTTQQKATEYYHWLYEKVQTTIK